MVKLSEIKRGTELIKRGFAKMQKGGVIMDVTNAEQARIAEDAGAIAVMALERVPADIRAEGGVARMADPSIIQEIMDAVSIPVMAKCRIGHFVEAQILEALCVDAIDESEVLTPANPFYHVDKRKFTVPFVCGCRNLGEAVRRIWEGATMIRTKGEAGTGNVIEAVRHRRMIIESIRSLKDMDEYALHKLSIEYAQSYIDAATTLFPNQKIDNNTTVFAEYRYEEVLNGIFNIIREIKKLQRLPVVDFAAGGIATPADAALMMQLGNDGVFVGSGIFKSSAPEKRASAIVDAVMHFDDPSILAEISAGLGQAMHGISIESIPKEERLQDR
jgi:pyridoxal 5'-phosphate synthase pdxS subunit